MYVKTSIPTDYVRPMLLALAEIHGSLHAVSERTGINILTIRRIYEREGKTVRAATVDKLYDALFERDPYHPAISHYKRCLEPRKKRRPNRVKCSKPAPRAGEGGRLYWGPAPPGVGGDVRPLEIGHRYYIDVPRQGSAGRRGKIIGTVSAEYPRYYLLECPRGLRTTVLKNDLCIKDTKVKKISSECES